MKRRLALAAVFGSTLILSGCGGRLDRELPEPAPRPVSIVKLKSFEPSAPELVSGVVGSWKTEEIGFEVSGRVEYVIEPESMVDGYLTSNTADPSLGGVVATVDPERYDTQLEGAKSQVTTLNQQLEALRVEHDDLLPARRDAAKAAEKLAEIEFERTKGLLERNAVPKARFDEMSATFEQAKAELKQAVANIDAKAAEMESLRAQIRQAEAAAKDAKKDVDDCKLRAPFRGQIAEVHVIPGAFVQRGEPVVTLQMMDPIKVEFEVSADRARRLRYKDEIKVNIYTPTGDKMPERGIVYQTGTVADAGTRTFTITVLLRNKLLSTLEAPDVDLETTGFTRDTWPLIKGLIGDGEHYYFEKNAIGRDAEGDFIFRIKSPPLGQQSLGTLLSVEKVRVIAEAEEASFLGLWTFRRVTLIEGSDIDPENDRFVGQVNFANDGSRWDGESVLFYRERWVLRPGDIIRVDLGSEGFGQGFYAPLSAIHEYRDKFYVYVAEADEDGETVARRVEVKLLDGPNTLRRIESVEESRPLKDDDRIVNGGVHFLVDGEPIKIVEDVQ